MTREEMMALEKALMDKLTEKDSQWKALSTAEVVGVLESMKETVWRVNDIVPFDGRGYQ